MKEQGLPFVLGLVSGTIFSDNLSLTEMVAVSIPCGGFRLLDIQAKQSLTEIYALGYIITRTGRYLIEHPEVIQEVYKLVY